MKNKLWVEKYRPRKISDCVLPKSLLNTFQEFVHQDNIPNMLLTGTAGTGNNISQLLDAKNKAS